MRVILFLAVFAACSDDGGSSANDVVACDPAWSATSSRIGDCERACMAMPASSTEACELKDVAANCMTPWRPTFDGTRGCCEIVPNGATDRVVFLECK